MFPTLYHFIYDLLGIKLEGLQFINTFGFFVALSIFAAYTVMRKEMKRLSEEGKLPFYTMKKWEGKSLSLLEYAWNGVLGFIFGYKILYLVFDENARGRNTQELVFSAEGSLLYGLVGMVLVLSWVYYGDRKNRNTELKELEVQEDASVHMGTISTIALVSGFIGAKLFHLLENPSEINPERFFQDFFTSGGWTFYGGLICGAGGVLWYTTKKGMKIWRVLDSGAVAMMLAYGIGRFGCHFSGDGDWGLPNTTKPPGILSFLPDWAWSYTYPHNVLGKYAAGDPAFKPIAGCEGDYCFELAVPVWPTPLYEALMGLLLAGILWYVLRKKVQQPGQLIAWYMVFAGVERFTIEIIREHGSSVYRLFGQTFAQAQLISVVLILAGAIWLIYSAVSKRRADTLK